MTQTTFPSTLAESYIYDAAGNLVSKTDRNNHSILYVYDALNRLIHKGYPDATGVDYIYDLVGKIKQVTDPTGTYGMAYDNMGRPLGTTTQYSFLPGHTYSNSYAYDAGSNKTQFTAPDTSTNTYVYDTLNRLTNLTDSQSGPFTFGYDALSRRTQLTRPNGITSSYAYDPVSHLQSILHKLGMNTIDGATYAYDFAGNRTSKTNMLNNTVSSFAYDNIYQLTGVTGAAAESYTFDPVGNRLASATIPSYTYNSSNELTAAGAASYTYDNNGNTLTKTDGTGTTNYTWDFENRLAAVVLPGSGGTVTFKYDPFGRRTQKSSASGTTNYLYDGANSIEEVDQSGILLARYTQAAGVDEPLAELRSGTASYYEQDGLGSVTSLSSSTGTLSNTYTYDAFGNLTAATGSLGNPFQYTGRDYDPETGLRYYRARYYDSTTGRFLSEDPIGFHGGSNFYAYVGNNPTNRTDPLGLRPLTPEQCRQLREVLALEEEYGTYIAAIMGNITFNSKGILADFNSQNSDYEPVPSARGPINLDWFSTLEATSGMGPAYLRYGSAKTDWIALKAFYKIFHIPGAPDVTNYVPYKKADERNAAWQVTIYSGYKDLFPPDWMQKNCPQACEKKK